MPTQHARKVGSQKKDGYDYDGNGRIANKFPELRVQFQHFRLRRGGKPIISNTTSHMPTHTFALSLHTPLTRLFTYTTNTNTCAFTEFCHTFISLFFLALPSSPVELYLSLRDTYGLRFLRPICTWSPPNPRQWSSQQSPCRQPCRVCWYFYFVLFARRNETRTTRFQNGGEARQQRRMRMCNAV